MLRSLEGGQVTRGVVLLAAAALAGWAASTATARTAHFQISVSVSGPGHVRGSGDGGSIDCPDSCTANIRETTELTLTATADAGAEFTGWGGSCVEYGSDPTCVLSISGPKSVTAGFGTPPPPPPPGVALTVTKTGSGTGYVGGAGGIDCGPTCSATVAPGSQVTLLALPDEGSTFTGWSGGGCSGAGQCSATITADTAVTAGFERVDSAAPHIATLPAAAVRGRTAQLRFRVFDDSGQSREVVTVLDGKRVLARIAVPLGSVVYRRVYAARWRVPRTLAPGRRRFCAVAVDAAGNRSTRSCSALGIR
jgi:hypothetical protein